MIVTMVYTYREERVRVISLRKANRKERRLIMKKEKIVRYSSEELRKLERDGGDKTDWIRVRNMKDENIIYDEDSPEITEDMFDKALVVQANTEIEFAIFPSVFRAI